MPVILSTAQVPDCEFLYETRVEAVNLPAGYSISIPLDPFKYRRKLWFATGVVNTPASYVCNGELIYSHHDSEVLRLPYHVNIGDGVYLGANGYFGTATNFYHFDEALFADYGGKSIGATPFRSIILANKITFLSNNGFNMAGGDTWFCFLALQQEFPY